MGQENTNVQKKLQKLFGNAYSAKSGRTLKMEC